MNFSAGYETDLENIPGIQKHALSNFDGHDLKEQIRSATDIVDLIGSSLELRRQGRGFAGLCPFHNDSKPSLTVNPERQSWRCFVCDLGGDVFSYVMKREGIDFRAAIEMLAERAGIVMKKHGPVAEIGSPNHKPTLYRAMAWAERLYHDCLNKDPLAEEARRYLAERNVNEESVKSFRLGFAPGGWGWLMDQVSDSPFTPEIMEAVGLARRSDKSDRLYDAYRERVIFTIRDTQNRPIGVGGRILPEFAKDNPAKYFNSPETRLYSKSDQLYALNVGREQLAQQGKENRIRNAIVMEGYTDVVLSAQHGIESPLACCGTALGARHLNVLRRFADRVTLLLDGDEAGQKAGAKSLELFIAAQMELRIATLPDGLDPADYVIQHGVEALNQLIEASPDALDFCVANATRGIDLANETVRATQALRQILTTMAKAPRPQEDTPTVFRLREQQTLNRLARMFRVEESMIRDTLKEEREKAKPRFDRPQEIAAQGMHVQATKPSLHGWEHELFMLLIKNPDAIAAVIEKISPNEMRTEMGRKFLEHYQQLEVDGRIANFENMMSLLEDPQEKNLMVELGESADRIHTESAEEQLTDLLATFEGRRQKNARRQQMAELDSGKLQEQEELELLNKLFESKKLEL